MNLIWMLFIGALIGAIAGMVTRTPMGWISNILAGVIGSYIGTSLLGNWGPHLAGMALLPSIIGAALLVFIVSLVFTSMNKRNRVS